ncbi:hypothetical protein [Paraglaciecola aquimarina]|uniref:hypothetical protein n=1 Tax=Paraglaciecola aquimarina TaxID=1235557 RepID=UPI003D166C22
MVLFKFTRAIIDMLPMRASNVPDTCADVSALAKDTGYQPKTKIEEGIQRFVDWYQTYYA